MPKSRKRKPPVANVPQFTESGDTTQTMSEIANADKLARVSKYHKWINQSVEAQEEFASAFVEGMKILANDKTGHYDEKALKTLEDEGRPALIINTTTSIVMTIVGLQRRAREIAKFLPGDPDDAEAVELLEYLYRWFYDQLGMKEKDASVFLRKYAGGLGFWKLFYDTRKDPRGKPSVKSLSPLSILWDPNWPEVEWDEAEYAIHAEWRTVDAATDEWPEHEEAIRHTVGEWIKQTTQAGDSTVGDALASKRYFWDPQTRRVRIAQVWYKRTRTAKVALWSDGSVEADPEKVKLIESEKPDRDVVQIVRMPVTTVYLAHLLDQIELSHDVTPLPFRDKLPILPALGYHFWKRPVGAVEYMRDPQREKNKRRSNITEIAGRATHSGFFNKEGTGANPDDIENYSSGAAVQIMYKQDIPVQINPPQLPQYLVYLEQQASADIPRSVNVNDELLGQTTAQTTSGRAIEARQRGGLLTQEIFFDSFANEQAEVAKLMIEMIRDTITIEEARRILGALAMRTKDGELQERLDGTPTDALDTLLSRAFDAQFDVIVTTQPYDPSGKMAGLRAMIDFFQVIQPPPEIAVELATQAGAIPKSLGEKWLRAIAPPPTAPPELPEGELPPEIVPPAPGGGITPVAPTPAGPSFAEALMGVLPRT